MDRWVAERGSDAGVYAGPRLGRPDADITTVVDGGAVLDVRRRAFLTRDHLVRAVLAWPGGPREQAMAGLFTAH